MAAPLGASLVDRLQDLAGEDLRNFNPITGFVDAPLLSLPDAIASISRASADADPMLPTRVELACDFADGILLDCEDSGQVEPLQRDEIAAIHLYTQNTSFYSQLNHLLRSRARQMLKPFAPYLKLLLGGLQKLPRIETTVFRGIKGNVSPSYKKGTKFVWWAVSSTTATIDCLSNPQFFGPSGERTLFTIAVKHAVDISRYSSLPSENELVLVPGSRMRVVGSVLNADGSCIIQCEEVSPPLGFFEFEERAVIGAANACSDNQAYVGKVADAADNVMASKGAFLPPQPHKEIAQVHTCALPVHSQSASASPPPPSAGAVYVAATVSADAAPPLATSLSIDIARTLVEGRLMTDKHARPGDRVNLRLQLCDSTGMFVLQTGHRWRVVIQSRDIDTDENAETLAAQQNVQVQDAGMGTYKVSFNAVAGPRRLLIVSETTGQCIPHFDFYVGVPPPQIPQPVVTAAPLLSAFNTFQNVADAVPVSAVTFCGPTCTIRHDAATSLCGRCSKPAGQHHGHICMTGQRGTFAVPFAAQVVPASAMAPAPMQGQRPPSKFHAGEWRGEKHPKWCAKEASDGKLCTHGSKTLLRYHWSCCGAPDNSSRSCIPPGGLNHTHRGAWREQAYTATPCSRVDDPDGEVCTHGTREIDADHWSCCGQGDRTSNACPPPLPANHTHTGEWRCVTDGSLTKYCSPLQSPDGEVCKHGFGVFQYDHWSCCGETTRESMVCCAPGGTNCQHPGQWRATEVGTRVCAAGALPGHPDACAHKPDPDMARSHWSCCADLNRASNTCLRQPTHAHTHPGDWRVSSAKRYTKHCSPTWEVEGRVCKHGAVIQASHWSCCGDRVRSSVACGTAPHPLRAPGMQAGPWQCSACTFQNRDGAKACQMCDGPCPSSDGGGADPNDSDSDEDVDERAAIANPHKQGVEHSLKTLPPDMVQMLKNATGNPDMVRMITERAQQDMPAHEFERMKAVLAALSQSSLHGGK